MSNNFLVGIYRRYFAANRKHHNDLRTLLGFTPGNPVLYGLAFCQRGAQQQISNKFPQANNERLEFLGDAVLSLVVADILFKRYPARDEGFLTELRSKIVNRGSLSQLGAKMGLNVFIQYYSKPVPGQTLNKAFLGNTLEALIGAVYLDKGYQRTRSFVVNQILNVHVDIDLLAVTETNFKSKLIDWCQRQGKKFTFEVIKIESDGGRAPKVFTIQAQIDQQGYETASHQNKKEAEKLAAERTYKILVEQISS